MLCLFRILILCIIDYVQNTQKENIPGILQVLQPRECKNYVLKCHKKNGHPEGEGKTFHECKTTSEKPGGWCSTEED